MKEVINVIDIKRNEQLNQPIFVQKKVLELVEIKECYEVVDSLIQEGIIKDIEKDIGYIYYVIPFGNMTDKELGISYTYNNFEWEIENQDPDFMKFVDYEKVLEDIRVHNEYDSNYIQYVNVEALGKALLSGSDFYLHYYKVGENVYGFDKNNSDDMRDYYPDEEVAKQCYLTIENHLENGVETIEAFELTRKDLVDLYEKDYVVKVSGTKFLGIINDMLERNDFLPIIEDDLRDISETQSVHYGNIQELMTYLNYAFECNSYYYDGLKHLLQIEKLSVEIAIKRMDALKKDEDYLYKELLTYLVPEAMNHSQEAA